MKLNVQPRHVSFSWDAENSSRSFGADHNFAPKIGKMSLDNAYEVLISEIR